MIQHPLSTVDLPECEVVSLGRVEAGAYRSYLKRWLDLILCTLALVGCLPLFLVAAALIVVETPGPVFFRQKRRGLDGKMFEIWKFRTMTDGADRQGSVTLSEDVRLTAVGKCLRDSKIDELPQIINILKGDMSIIGPRPLSEAESLEIESIGFPRNYEGFVHRCRPGLIGLEQSQRDRRQLTYEQRFDLNRRYTATLSFENDLRIFLVSIIQCRLVCSLSLLTALAELLVILGWC